MVSGECCCRTWLLRETGNSAPEADPQNPSKTIKNLLFSLRGSGHQRILCSRTLCDWFWSFERVCLVKPRQEESCNLHTLPRKPSEKGKKSQNQISSSNRRYFENTLYYHFPPTRFFFQNCYFYRASCFFRPVGLRTLSYRYFIYKRKAAFNWNERISEHRSNWTVIFAAWICNSNFATCFPRALPQKSHLILLRFLLKTAYCSLVSNAFFSRNRIQLWKMQWFFVLSDRGLWSSGTKRPLH